MTMLLAARLDRAMKAAGVPITGVSIGDTAKKATWTVHPQTLQRAAQPTIDAFDPNDPAHAAWEAQQERDVALGLKMIRALASATHKRLKVVVPTDTTTAAQWTAAIIAEWDAL